MQTIKLNDEIYKDFHILTESEYKAIDTDFKGYTLHNSSVKCAFLPGCGTVLYFENIHFLIISDREPVKKFTIWRNHKVVGYCNITKKAAEKANAASNAVFFFGFDEKHKLDKLECEKVED